jgi:hypothetical protein
MAETRPLANKLHIVSLGFPFKLCATGLRIGGAIELFVLTLAGSTRQLLKSRLFGMVRRIGSRRYDGDAMNVRFQPLWNDANAAMMWNYQELIIKSKTTL